MAALKENTPDAVYSPPPPGAGALITPKKGHASGGGGVGRTPLGVRAGNGKLGTAEKRARAARILHAHRADAAAMGASGTSGRFFSLLLEAKAEVERGVLVVGKHDEKGTRAGLGGGECEGDDGEGDGGRAGGEVDGEGKVGYKGGEGEKLSGVVGGAGIGRRGGGTPAGDREYALRLARSLDLEGRDESRERARQELADAKLAKKLAMEEEAGVKEKSRVEGEDAKVALKEQKREALRLMGEAKTTLQAWKRPRVKAQNLSEKGGVQVSCLLPCLATLRVTVDPDTAEVGVTARPDLGKGGRKGWDKIMKAKGKEKKAVSPAVTTASSDCDSPSSEESPASEFEHECDLKEFGAEGTLAQFAACVRAGWVEPDASLRASSVALALDLRIVGKTSCAPDDVTATWDRETGWVKVFVRGAALEGGTQDGVVDTPEDEEEGEGEGGEARSETTWKGSTWLKRAASNLKAVFSKKKE